MSARASRAGASSSIRRARRRDRAGGVDHRRQHRALRRDRGRVLFPRRRRRALRRAQLRRHRGGRRRGRPLLRIHDRRRRGRARQDRAATSRPACRAASPMCSTRTGASRSAATCRWSSSSRCSRRKMRAARALSPGRRPRHHGRVDVMSDMSRYDAERLHQLIANHARYTGSKRAEDDPRGVERVPAEVPQGDAGRVPPRACRR